MNRRVDHKGYEIRPMDTQDVIVLVACAIAAAALIGILLGGW